MSFGINSVSLASDLAFTLVHFIDLFPKARESLRRDYAVNVSDTTELAKFLTPRVYEHISNSKIVKDAQNTFKQELQNARDANSILVFGTPSNDYKRAGELGDFKYAENDVYPIPEILKVGAVNIHDPENPSDDEVAEFSPDGNIFIAAPGMNIPVEDPGPKKDGSDSGLGVRVPKDTEGTSFAAPFVVSVAALMLSVKPSLKPDEVVSIFRDKNVAFDIPDTKRDGAGVINPVLAVQAAKQFKSKDEL